MSWLLVFLSFFFAPEPPENFACEDGDEALDCLAPAYCWTEEGTVEDNCPWFYDQPREG
jgi:hypothetical protein